MSSDPNRTKKTVYVAGLDTAVTTEYLHQAFLPFGEIAETTLPTSDRQPSAHRGFGYVEFTVAEDAAAAIDNMDQSELYGRVIKCSQAKPVKDKTEGLGSKLAVWEQEGWLARHEVSEEDKLGGGEGGAEVKGLDPMQGLEGLDVAGPKPL